MKRRYTDKEAGALIQRATELQEGAAHSSAHTLSFKEIEHIAAEIGIDPRHLRSAALELERGGFEEEEKSFSILGGPFRIERTQVVDGKVTEEQWERLVLEARRLTGNKGETGAIGQTQEWSYDVDGLASTHVALSPRGDQTTLHVQKEYRNGAFGAYFLSTFFSAFLTVGFLSGSGLSDLGFAAVIAMVIIAALAVARMGLGLWASRQRKQVAQLLDHLDEIAAPPAPEAVEKAPRASIELPAWSEEGEAEPAPVATRPGHKASA